MISGPALLPMTLPPASFLQSRQLRITPGTTRRVGCGRGYIRTRPRPPAYRPLPRGHRLPHFRNERYWRGVSRRFGDKVLGTNPQKQDVEISPTAKTALAAR